MRSTRITSSTLRVLIGAIALTGLVAFTGCTAPGSDPEQPGGEVGTYYPAGEGTDEEIDVITWGILGTTGSLDPNKSTAAPNWALLQAVLEPLVQINNRGEIVPVLAESYELTDPTTIDIVIRDNVTFWDGSPLTVDDVLFSFEHVRAPDGAQSGSFSSIESVTATGDNSIQIKLSTPQPEQISWLALAFIIDKEFTEAAGETFGTPEGLVMGTGAYQPESFAPATGSTLVRYEDYWGDLPSAKKIEVKIFNDAQALKLAVQSGDIDGTMDVPRADIPAWENLDGITVGNAQGANPDPYLILDTTQAPFDDIHARRAMAALVDREGIIAAIYAGHATAARSISSPLLWANYVDDQSEVEEFFDGLPQIEFDTTLAAEELAQSATPDGFAITILTPHEAAPEYTSVAQTLKEAGAEIGIDITVERVSTAEWIESMNAEDRPQISIVGWASTAATPLVVPISMVRPVPSPWSSYNTDSVQTAIDEYLNSTDKAEQLQLSKDVLTELAEELPFVPITFPEVTFAINDDYVFGDWSAWKYYGGNNWAATIKVAAE